MMTEQETVREIGRSMTRRCTNCYRELEGYNTGRWHWVDGNVGPFCGACWEELLKWRMAADK